MIEHIGIARATLFEPGVTSSRIYAMERDVVHVQGE
jgi:hypothetical protein